MGDHVCSTCGWIWERDGQPVSDAENSAALDQRLTEWLDAFMAKHPEVDWSLDADALAVVDADRRGRYGIGDKVPE